MDFGGEGGIRTHDTLTSMPHFECGDFNHSTTSPTPCHRGGSGLVARSGTRLQASRCVVDQHSTSLLRRIAQAQVDRRGEHRVEALLVMCGHCRAVHRGCGRQGWCTPMSAPMMPCRHPMPELAWVVCNAFAYFCVFGVRLGVGARHQPCSRPIVLRRAVWMVEATDGGASTRCSVRSPSGIDSLSRATEHRL